MSQGEKLQLSQRLRLRLSQQQLRFVKLLEQNASELDETVQREMSENPALVASEDDNISEPSESIPKSDDANRHTSSQTFNSSYSFSTPSRNSNDDSYYPELSDSSESLYDYLNRQLNERRMSESVRRAAEYIIGNLDGNGWLRRDLKAVQNDMIFNANIDVSDDDMEEAYGMVRSLDPAGIGASSLQDCLILQLQRLKKSREVDDAVVILSDYYEPFTMKHTHKIISAFGMDKERVEKAMNLILSLNPKPGAAFGTLDTSNVIIPDIVVDIDDDNINLRLNNHIPELRIDTTFETALSEMETARKKRESRRRAGNDFVATRVKDARDFISVLRQRQETLMQVTAAIVNIQKEYFLTQDVYALRPMMIKDISQLTGLDISVISRATNNKYIATPWGTLPMRFFFSDTVGEADGAEALTNRKIEAEISRLVNTENKKHPLSDEKIKQQMSEAGFELSRRTVAKYRDRLGIPVARLRKTIGSN